MDNKAPRLTISKAVDVSKNLSPSLRSSLALVLLLLCLCRTASAGESGIVVKVRDGDTIEVMLGRRVEPVRLIGVDTPEIVDPRKPIQRFAREASAFTKRITLGQHVSLEPDPECRNRDRYHRLLRYVYLANGRCVNAQIIIEGYGFAYTKYPFTRMDEFRGYQRAAIAHRIGLWAN